MIFFAVGTNYKYSPVRFRERLFFSKRTSKDILSLLKERDVLKSAVTLSTCNRTEIYASAEDMQLGIDEVVNFISEYHEVDKKVMGSYLYIYEGKNAVKHLFEVCAGLDSLIVGELQILGQVKASLNESESMGFIEELLRNVFLAAISNSKMIRERTRISDGKVSVGSVAVEFIKREIGHITGKNVLIVGVGKVTELVLKYLKGEGLSVIFVSNRTFDRARQLADQIGAQAFRFDNLREVLRKVDAVISATASPHFIIKKEMLKEVENPLLIVDLGMPRDVDPKVKELQKITLYCFEDLDAVIKRNRARKVMEAKKALHMIDIEVERLWVEFLESEREPVLLP